MYERGSPPTDDDDETGDGPESDQGWSGEPILPSTWASSLRAGGAEVKEAKEAREASFVKGKKTKDEQRPI